MSINIFQLGDFTLHSGQKSNFKIECDTLGCDDYRALAQQVANKFKFGYVYGVPRGGLEFAEYLKAHIDSKSSDVLIVDDVLTTASSIEEFKKSLPFRMEPTYTIGVVIFARGVCPSWVHPIFQMW